MPVTTNRGYSTPPTGAEVDIWGSNDLNPNFGMIDNNLGGVSNVALSNTSVTLTSAQYQCGTIRLSGALTTPVSVIFPVVQGWWTIDNQTTGAFVATITIGSGQVIAVEQGVAADILIDGTNVKFRNLPTVGSYLDICDATIPAWITACTVPPFLNCDGTTFSAVTYPYLNTKLGGNTLPDLRGGSRATLNQGTGRITTAGSGIDGNTRFSIGGGQTQTLTAAQIPAITSGGVNSISFGGNVPLTVGTGSSNNAIATSSLLQIPFTTASWSFIGTVSPTINVSSNNTGSQAHPIMQPTTISGITLIRAA